MRQSPLFCVMFYCIDAICDPLTFATLTGPLVFTRKIVFWLEIWLKEKYTKLTWKDDNAVFVFEVVLSLFLFECGGTEIWTMLSWLRYKSLNTEQTALREERGVLFLFQGGNMIYMPLTIKVSVLLEQVLAIILQHCLQGHCPFSFSLQCIVYQIGIYIPLLHIADMDGLTHFLCLDNWAHFVCVLFYFRISFILCDFLSA